MREEYSGFMAPLICRSIPDLQPAFDEFASDLKRATEVKLEELWQPKTEQKKIRGN
jgi:hypothetical protein